MKAISLATHGYILKPDREGQVIEVSVTLDEDLSVGVEVENEVSVQVVVCG